MSVNPFKRMYDVGPEYIRKYRGANQGDLPPHVYWLADSMYRHMVDDAESQSVIISYVGAISFSPLFYIEWLLSFFLSVLLWGSNCVLPIS